MHSKVPKLLAVFSHSLNICFPASFLKNKKNHNINQNNLLRAKVPQNHNQFNTTLVDTTETQFKRRKYYPQKGNTSVQQYSQEQHRKQKQKYVEQYSNRYELNLIEKLNQMELKPFSIACHKLLIKKEKSQLIWSAIQSKFVYFLSPTTDSQKIRSYAIIIYSLSKSKIASQNYQIQMSLLLPFASHQSFTQITVSMSRMGPLSEQFSHIIQKFYYKRKGQFNPRQRVQINYTLTKNGKMVDKTIMQLIDSLNLVQIISMLRSYDNSLQLKASDLIKCTSHIRARKNQMNVLDLADLMNLYTKHKVMSKQILQLFQWQYEILARNINEEAFQKIWEHVPEAINQNLISIKLLQNMKRTIKIFKKKQLFCDKIWDKVQRSFQKITNLEVRVNLQKIQ